MGHKHAFEEGLGRGTGFLGISVALLGRAHPIGVARRGARCSAFLSSGGLAVGRPRAEGADRDAAGRRRARGRGGGAVGARARECSRRGEARDDDRGVAARRVAFLAQVMRIAVPYVLAALGGAITERVRRDRPRARGEAPVRRVRGGGGRARDGLARTPACSAGIAAGMAVAAVQILFALRLGADQVIVGVGAQPARARRHAVPAPAALRRGRELAAVAGVRRRGRRRTRSCGSRCSRAVAMPLALARTRWGLRLRAAGDRPDALVAVGVSPLRARLCGGARRRRARRRGRRAALARRSAASSPTCRAAAATSRSRW